MLEMASLGAKVLQIRSVKFATQYGVPIHVRSSFNDAEGTWVMSEEDIMERLVVSGVTHKLNEAKIRVSLLGCARTSRHRGQAVRAAFAGRDLDRHDRSELV